MQKQILNFDRPVVTDKFADTDDLKGGAIYEVKNTPYPGEGSDSGSDGGSNSSSGGNVDYNGIGNIIGNAGNALGSILNGVSNIISAKNHKTTTTNTNTTNRTTVGLFEGDKMLWVAVAGAVIIVAIIAIVNKK